MTRQISVLCCEIERLRKENGQLRSALLDALRGAENESIRPLFIPLSGRFYDQFVSGEKRSELRRYGKRWNETTCAIGRHVLLSRGYGKQRRIAGIIREFYKRQANTFGSTYQKAILDCYGTLDLVIAEIRIDLGVGYQCLRS